MTEQQALNTIENIVDCIGYKESEGDLWLGPRLEQLRDYIGRYPGFRLIDGTIDNARCPHLHVVNRGVIRCQTCGKTI